MIVPWRSTAMMMSGELSTRRCRYFGSSGSIWILLYNRDVTATGGYERDYFPARGRNFGSVTSSVIGSKTASTGIPIRMSWGLIPTMLEMNFGPSSSFTITTAYGTSGANAG